MRKANLIQTAIWRDEEFLALASDAKLLYLSLLTQPDVSAVGRLSLTARRWSLITGLSTAKLGKALRDLETAGFVWTDEEHEELVIRSWVKHNVQGAPKMEKAATDQFGVLASASLRVHLQTAYPSLFGTPPDTLSHTLSNTLYQKTAAARGVEVRGAEVQRYEENGTSERARVWSAYTAHHPRAVLSADRMKLIDQRLSEFPEATLIAAIDGNHRSEFHREHGHHDLALIFRSADKIERFAAEPVNGRPSTMSPAGRTFELARQLREAGR